MPAHPFVAKHASTLPSEWQIAPSEEWLAHAAPAMAIPRSDLASTVCFELPDCTPAREYLAFDKAMADNGDDVILVCLTNHSDYDNAHGTGSAMQTILQLHSAGFPRKYMRICHKK